MSSIINVEEYIGKQYGNYYLISFEYFINYSKSRQPFYKCKCTNCNNEYVIGLWNLRNRKDKNCKYCYGKSKSLPNAGSSLNSLFSTYKRNALNRNYEFNISKEEFINIINKNCHYCDKKPSNIIRSKCNIDDFIYNGIDRIDNTKGYILNNIKSCCGQCNRAKTDMSLNDFKEWIFKVHLKFNECVACES